MRQPKVAEPGQWVKSLYRPSWAFYFWYLPLLSPSFFSVLQASRRIPCHIPEVTKVALRHPKVANPGQWVKSFYRPSWAFYFWYLPLLSPSFFLLLQAIIWIPWHILVANQSSIMALQTRETGTVGQVSLSVILCLLFLIAASTKSQLLLVTLNL